MTYYLPVTRGEGASYSTYLRNPERNQGVFFGVKRIEQDPDGVRLVGARRGRKEESVVATGRRDADILNELADLFAAWARETCRAS